jgi:hypothetical protein
VQLASRNLGRGARPVPLYFGFAGFSARSNSRSKSLRFGTGISTGSYGLPVFGSMPFGWVGWVGSRLS